VTVRNGLNQIAIASHTAQPTDERIIPGRPFAVTTTALCAVEVRKRSSARLSLHSHAHGQVHWRNSGQRFWGTVEGPNRSDKLENGGTYQSYMNFKTAPIRRNDEINYAQWFLHWFCFFAQSEKVGTLVTTPPHSQR